MIHFVGAGSGASDLITVRGQKFLREADVVIYAVCDALLGAANMRDIGYHFPDTAGEYKNIDSKILLRDTMKLLRDAGYELGNIDATVAAERPKLNPHIPLMKKTLAEVMNCAPRLR